MRAATIVQQLCKSCRTCFKFYCMFCFTCDRSFRPLQFINASENWVRVILKACMFSARQASVSTAVVLIAENALKCTFWGWLTVANYRSLTAEIRRCAATSPSRYDSPGAGGQYKDVFREQITASIVCEMDEDDCVMLLACIVLLMAFLWLNPCSQLLSNLKLSIGAARGKGENSSLARPPQCGRNTF